MSGGNEIHLLALELIQRNASRQASCLSRIATTAERIEFDAGKLPIQGLQTSREAKVKASFLCDLILTQVEGHSRFLTRNPAQ